MPSTLRSVLALLLIAACGGDDSTSGSALLVDLRTDFVAGFEFERVEVELLDMPPSDDVSVALERVTTRFTSPSDELLAGRRVAEFAGVSTGDRYLLARLFRGDDSVLARQVMLVRVEEDTGVTLVITRDCGGVECPAPGGSAELLACLRGMCVDPRCPLEPEFCPPTECEADADCADFDAFPANECAAFVCHEQYCFAGTSVGACPEGEWCHPQLGCLVGEPGPLRDGSISPDGGDGCVQRICDPGVVCRVGGTSCVDGSCEVIGVAFPGAPCDGGECTEAGLCGGYQLAVERRGSGSGQVVSEPGGVACGTTCSARFEGGTEVTLTAVADAGSRFESWEGGACDGSPDPVCTFEVTTGETIGARFAAESHTLTVTLEGDASGAVTGGAIDCGASCEAILMHGDEVTLVGIPEAGASFAGWGGACSGSGPCTLRVERDVEVSAAFTTAADFLRVEKEGDGFGEVVSAPAGIACGSTCASPYDAGTSVTLVATAAEGSTFVGWSGGCSGTGTCVVEVSGETVVRARFRREGVMLHVEKEGAGDGVVSSSPAGILCGDTCESTFPHDTTVTLTAAAAASSELVGWTGGGCGAGAICVVTLREATTVRARFEPRDVDLEILPVGPGSGVVTSAPAGISCGAACRASFSAGTRVRLDAAANAGSEVRGFGLDCVGDVCATFVPGDSYELTLAAPTAVTVFYELLEHRLRVTRDGDGMGSVEADLGPIDCGATCAGDYLHGTSVSLTATPAGDSSFAGWGGACASFGSTPTCTVEMEGARNVTATFLDVDDDEGVLNVSRLGDGTGTVTSEPAGIDCGGACSASFPSGESVELTAIPNTGSTFTGWGGACSGTDTTCLVSVGDATLVTATFTVDVLTLEVTLGGTGVGSVSGVGVDCPGTCSVDLPYGTEVDLSQAPAASSTFSRWSGGCAGSGACRFMLRADTTVNADFELRSHALGVSLLGDGGGEVTSAPAGIDCGADCDETYDHGTRVTLSANADVDSRFVGWSGACSGTGACEVTMTAARNVSARFDLERFDLEVTRSGCSGRVTSSPSGIDCGADCGESYASGTSVTLSASETASCAFVGWGGACSGAGGCVTTMSADRSVSATFETRRHDLDVSVSGPGEVSGAGIDCGADCSETYDHGTMVTLTASATGVGSFVGWGGACASEPTSVCTVNMTAARSVSASFASGNTLVVTVVGGGEVSSTPGGIDCPGDCEQGYGDGVMVTLNATPDPGFELVGWSGACSGTGSCVVTMDAARAVTATFALRRYDLVVTRAGGGVGRVSSSPVGIDCGSDCVEAYDHGATVTLTPSAMSGSVFTGWGGDCSGSGACNVTMTAARNVSARFELERFELRVGVTGDGTVDSSPSGIADCREDGGECDAGFDHGTEVTLEADPDPGWVVDAWSGVSGCGSSTTCVVTVTASVDVRVGFVRDTERLSVSVEGPDDAGGVTSSPAGIDCGGGTCSADFPVGTSVTLTAEARSGYQFVKWDGDCAFAGSATTCVLEMDATRDAIAIFDLVSAGDMLSVSVQPRDSGLVLVYVDGRAQSSCSSSCTYPATLGATIELRATEPSVPFLRWGAGACSGSMEPRCTFSFGGATSATAVYGSL